MSGGECDRKGMMQEGKQGRRDKAKNRERETGKEERGKEGKRKEREYDGNNGLK